MGKAAFYAKLHTFLQFRKIIYFNVFFIISLDNPFLYQIAYTIYILLIAPMISAPEKQIIHDTYETTVTGNNGMGMEKISLNISGFSRSYSKNII